MKRILFSLLFLFVAFTGYGQFVNTTTTGSPTTLFKSRGGLGADSAFILLNNYADTTAANFSVASKYSGSFIRVDTSIYYRTLNPNKWNLFAKVGSTGTIVSISQGYGIVNSPNPITTVGTITTDTTVIVSKSYFSNFNALNVKYSDTASMLTPYLRKSDTASMLSGYTRVNRFLDTTSVLRALINTKGGGTVTSVGLSMPSIFSVSGSPVTTSGTLTADLVNQNANLVFAGPATGSPAQPTFRSLVAADLTASTLQTVTDNGNNTTNSISVEGDAIFSNQLRITANTPAANNNTIQVTSTDFSFWGKSGGYFFKNSTGANNLRITDSGNVLIPIMPNGGTDDSIVVVRNSNLKKISSSSSVYANLPFVTLEQFGAVGNGVTDDYSALESALLSGKAIFLGKKTYYIGSQVILPAQAMIFGSGDSSVIKIGNNYTALITVTGSAITLKDFKIKGGLGTSYGLVLYNTSADNIIDGVRFDSLQRGLYVYSSVNPHRPQIISNCLATNCTYGFYNGASGEYTTYSNCVANRNEYGWHNGGGNNNWNGGAITDNTVIGIEIVSGANDAHSIISGATINHNENYSIVVDGISLGYTFANCMVYYGKILVRNSTGVSFIGGDWSDMDSVQFNNATNARVIDVNIKSTPVIDTAYSGGNSNVQFFNVNYASNPFSPPAVIRNKINGAIIARSNETITQVFNSTATNGPYVDFQKSGVSQLYIGNSEAISGASNNIELYARIGKGLSLWTNNGTRGFYQDVNADITIDKNIFLKTVATGSGTDSVLVKTTDGQVKKIAQTTVDTTTLLSQVVRTFGNQTVAGKKTHTDSLVANGLRLTLGMTGTTGNFSSTLAALGSTTFGTHDGTNFYNFERYNSGAPYAYLRAGSTDLNVPVGLGFQTRGNDGAALDALLITGPGAATFGGTLGINGVSDNIKGGTYTPTSSSLTNLSSATPNQFTYTRVGNIVTVSGSVTVSITSNTTITRVSLTLPVSSNLAMGDLTGTGGCTSSVSVQPLYASADVANDLAILDFISNITGSQTIYVNFQYIVN